MHFGNDSIVCTVEHPFFVNHTWVAAKVLRAGDSLFAFGGEKLRIDSVYDFKTDTATAVYNLEAAGNHNYYVSASEVLAHNCETGGLNLYKWDAYETSINNWKTGDRMLFLPNQGTPKLNWMQNASRLRSEMRLGKPIFDSYRYISTGEYIPTKGFLNAERNLLKNHGWYYDINIGAWLPPGF